MMSLVQTLTDFYKPTLNACLLRYAVDCKHFILAVRLNVKLFGCDVSVKAKKMKSLLIFTVSQYVSQFIDTIRFSVDTYKFMSS